MQTITTPTARHASFGDLRVVERSRGTAHPQAAGRTRVAPTSLLAPSARRRPVAR